MVLFVLYLVFLQLFCVSLVLTIFRHSAQIMLENALLCRQNARLKNRSFCLKFYWQNLSKPTKREKTWTATKPGKAQHRWSDTICVEKHELVPSAGNSNTDTKHGKTWTATKRGKTYNGCQGWKNMKWYLTLFRQELYFPDVEVGNHSATCDVIIFDVTRLFW